MEREYLKSLGLQDIATQDSDDASKLWELQKAKTKEALKHITIEHLQERENAMLCLMADYHEKVTKIEAELKDSVKLHDKKGKLLTEEVRIKNLVGRIKAVSPIPLHLSSYRSKKGKWDGLMLGLTSYHELLSIYSSIKNEEQNRITRKWSYSIGR
jgi:hypothetical protein